LIEAPKLRARRYAVLAIGLWAALALAIGIYVVTHPGQRTVTPTYRIAAGSWFAGRGLYNVGGDIGGFVYFPHAALVYAPFTALPHDVGEILWRFCGLALVASGIHRLAGLIQPDQRNRTFLICSLLCLPATVSSARNGQMNLHLAGLMLHATVDLAARVWWRAALSLVLGLVLKPFAAVPLLLAAAVYPPTRVWIAAASAGAVIVPFLTQGPAYVIRQYGACLLRLAQAGVPHTDTWSDLRGLLLRFGALPNEWLVLMRLSAAIPTLLLSFAARRHGEAWSAVYLFALAASYLMIFNPRTEANSYVLLAPAVAAMTVRAASRRQTGAVWTLVAFALALGCENYGRTIFAMTDLWLKPLLTIGFAAYLIACIRETGAPTFHGQPHKLVQVP
jgi:hypothetical protein